MNRLIYTIGIGAVFSVTTLGIPMEEICVKQEMAYKAFFYYVIARENESDRQFNDWRSEFEKWLFVVNMKFSYFRT